MNSCTTIEEPESTAALPRFRYMRDGRNLVCFLAASHHNNPGVNVVTFQRLCQKIHNLERGLTLKLGMIALYRTDLVGHAFDVHDIEQGSHVTGMELSCPSE